MLDRVRDWLERFICPTDPRDLDLLTLWAAHTHLVMETYTSPRLLIESPVPESGKTTVLEHLERLCLQPIQMASVSSPAMLTRVLEKGPRTLLIDEADRSLKEDKPGIDDLIAVLNSGYKKGATRPVLVPIKGGGWDTAMMPTYAAVGMAGNRPKLPEDTLSRVIRVLIMPDHDGSGGVRMRAVCGRIGRISGLSRMADDWTARIGRHVTADGCVVVPPRMAHWLEQKAGVTADRRIALRDTDAEAYAVLAALRIASLSHGSEKGTKGAVGQPKQEESDQWLTTAEAAAEQGVTERAIRKRIATGRLPARRRGWQWLINRTDLQVQALAA